MFNINQKIASTDHIAAGTNIKLHKHGDKVIISSNNTDTTTFKHGEHILKGEFIEVESGDGIIINTAHPNKLKISIDYKFLIPLIERIKKLEGGI